MEMPEIMRLHMWGQEVKKQLDERDEQEQEQAFKDNIRARVAKKLNEQFDQTDRMNGRKRTSKYYHTQEQEQEDYDPFWQLKLVTSSL